MTRPTGADAALVLDVRDLTAVVADGEDGPVLLLTDTDSGVTCAEISAGMARPGDPDVTEAIARIARALLRYASLLQTAAPTPQRKAHT